MRRETGPDEPALITDAAESLEDEQRRRRRMYSLLMVIHLAGLVAAGVLWQHWLLALVIVIVTGALPWVAVVVANDAAPRRRGRPTPP